MNTKIFISCLMLALALVVEVYPQTLINKTIPVSPGQKIVMHFDFPELIRVTTWDKNEISIGGSVSINGGENDDAFELSHSTSGSTITVRNEIKNMKSLPQRITIVDGTQKIVFRNKEEFRKYQAENGKSNFNRMSHGVDMDILLEIKVPRNVDTRVESVYGMVEINDFQGPLVVASTYGGVDAALTETATGEIIAETNFGEIYTNLDTKFGSNNVQEKDFHTFVSAKPGKGPTYNFESKYGNVYIRKSN